MIDPEDVACGDADGGREGVGLSVATDVDAAPVVEFFEHFFGPVALALERGFGGNGHLAVDLGRDAGSNVVLDERELANYRPGKKAVSRGPDPTTSQALARLVRGASRALRAR